MAAIATQGGGQRENALRRYPALVWLVAASMLALLLPSGLTVLQSGPPTLAEFAPVPGEGQGTSDVGQLGQASSGGVGFGSGRGGEAGEVVEQNQGGGGRVEYRPGTKRCVRHPDGMVRQTEDPLSPPCIAFFEGDNFGATGKGVTADEVRVAAFMNNTATDPQGRQSETYDCASPPTSDDAFQDQLCKAYMRYFNERYQTYGRTVHLWSAHINVSLTDLDERLGLFASVAPGSSSQPDRRILGVGYSGNSRVAYRRDAPYRITFRADYEDQDGQTASYICDKLAKRPARFAGDPAIRASDRRFGVLFTDDSRRARLMSALSDRCEVDIAVQTGDWQSPASIARLRQEGVTTVILIAGNTAHATATTNATQIGYFPEWFITPDPGLTGIDINFNGRTANQAQWANSFGLTLDIRRAALNEQPWYRAYREGCGTCAEPQLGQQGVLFAAAMYDSMAMLFYGIQAAGPRLTPENIDRGLHAIPPAPSADPFRPAAYFAPGNWSFVKDAMAIWWDPTGRPPGSASAGCYRLPHEGRRFRAGEWLPGDGDVKGAGPCQADTFQ